MIIGYGDVGSLALRYALDSRITEEIYLVVRDSQKYDNKDANINNPKVRLINFKEKKFYYPMVEAIISCTSAPHPVVKLEEFKELILRKPLVVYDLAVPRDVEEGIKELPKLKLYDIDSLNVIDEENKNKRRQVMYENMNIIDKFLEDYMTWKS